MCVEDSREREYVKVNIDEDSKRVVPVENGKRIIDSFTWNDNETSLVNDERQQ